MKPILTSLAAGGLFGVGLGVSGMTRADKVIDFLDLSDSWDPSLGLVMAAAIAVHLVLFPFILRQPSPIYGARFGIPTRTDIDARLVGGAAIFGVGWALGGYCPGPGLVSMSSGGTSALVFVASLTAGMLVFHAVEEALRGSGEQPARTPELEIKSGGVFSGAGKELDGSHPEARTSAHAGPLSA